ncbi:MAG TPA: hypothetical protein VF174_16345, partial [Micromonosporaceae bacterium]
MTRTIRGARRTAAVLAASAAALLVSGCGAGQLAETANQQPSIPGTIVEVRTGVGQYHRVVNLLLAYPGLEGYRAGADARAEAAIYNDTDQPVTVTISSDNAREVRLVANNQPPAEETPDGEPGPTPTDAAQGEPARFEIPARGFVIFGPQSERQLLLVGLDRALKPGQSVSMVITFGDQQIEMQAPVRVPLSPVPPAAPIVEGEHA